MDSLDRFMKTQPPTALRPLLGQTILAVEDSRFACEAVRLLCLKSGARVRRADSLSAARRHLGVYRPSVVLIDMGLPDGSGAELISELARTSPRPIILATSGDEAERAAALDAGAEDFLPKPISTLALFQSAILKHLPPDRQPKGPRPITGEIVAPDEVAYQDDLAHAQEALAAGEAEYGAQFIASLARCGGDEALRKQAEKLRWSPDNDEELGALATMVRERLGERIAV
ncbi:MAG: response regulator [Pseudomonadota bacterium]